MFSMSHITGAVSGVCALPSAREKNPHRAVAHVPVPVVGIPLSVRLALGQATKLHPEGIHLVAILVDSARAKVRGRPWKIESPNNYD